MGLEFLENPYANNNDNDSDSDIEIENAGFNLLTPEDLVEAQNVSIFLIYPDMLYHINCKDLFREINS